MFCRPLKGWEGMSSYSRQFSLKNFKKHMKGMHEEHLFPFYVWSMKVEDVSPFMRFPRLHRVHCTYNVQPHWSHLMFSNTNCLKMFLGVTLLIYLLLQETHVEHIYCWGSISFYEIPSIASYPATLLAPPYNYHTYVSDLTLNRCWCSYSVGKV